MTRWVVARIAKLKNVQALITHKALSDNTSLYKEFLMIDYHIIWTGDHMKSPFKFMLLTLLTASIITTNIYADETVQPASGDVVAEEAPATVIEEPADAAEAEAEEASIEDAPATSIEADATADAEDAPAVEGIEAPAAAIEDSNEDSDLAQDAEEKPVAVAPKFSAPFASGNSKGLDWEVRFNLPNCDHEGEAKDAWCEVTDANRASKKNGVEAKLKSWIKDPKVKSVYLSYFSFSNKGVRKALCTAAKDEARNLKVTVYIDSGNEYHANVRALDECSKNTTVIAKGKGPFGSSGAHLQHSKIFMASEVANLKPLHEMNAAELKEISGTKLRWTSSSANMSSYGTTLHFENWLFFGSDASASIAQQNVCVFRAFTEKNDRRVFAKAYRECIKKIKAPKRKDIEFYAVPSSRIAKPYTAMTNMINNADSEVLVAIHRLTTGKIYRTLFRDAAYRGVDVKIIFDDDTLRSSKVNGGHAHDVGRHDVLAYRTLRRDAQIYFMQTNAETTTHLFHNKFIVADGKSLFQGAGNFTGTALNVNGSGNYEQFYYITIPAIVKAYKAGWEVLQGRATRQDRHPIYKNKDKQLSSIGH